MALASLIVAVAALLWAALAWFSARAAAKRAAGDAGRALTAARRSVDAAKRSAGAIQEWSVATARKQHRPPAPGEIEFELQWRGGAEYSLTNTGTSLVTGVYVQGPLPNVRVLSSPPGEVMRPGQSLGLIIEGSVQLPFPTSVTICCHELPAPIRLDIPSTRR